MLRKLLFGLYFIVTLPLFAEESTVKSGDAELFCRTIGKGAPLVVLHGGPGLTQDYLLPQMEKLGDHHFVIFYDQRACGASGGEVSCEKITLANYINDLEVIRKAFKLEKMALLGHSWD